MTRFDLQFKVNTEEEFSGSVLLSGKKVVSFECVKATNRKSFKFHGKLSQKTYGAITDHLVSHADLRFGRTFIWIDNG